MGESLRDSRYSFSNARRRLATLTEAPLSRRAMLSAAIVFAVLILLLLPFQPVGKASLAVEITATGERNAQARSSEVWIVQPAPDTVQATGDTGMWQEKNAMLGSFGTQPATIRLAVDVAEHPALELATHAFAGKAVIRVQGVHLHEDLYSDGSGIRRIDLRQFGSGGIDWPATMAKLALQFVGAVLAILLLVRVLAWAGMAAVPGRHSTLIQAALYALPSVLMYVGVHLAVWPGQMSPDSLDQWGQLHGGQLSDAHPILATGIYAAARVFSDSPALAVAIQYVFLALMTGLLIAEMRQWGIRNGALWVIACLVPAFPANFLIATTLWKDVPYAAGLIWLAWGALRLVRQGFRPRVGDYVGLAAAGLLVTGLRHNGIIISVFFFIALCCCARGNDRVRFGGLVVLQCVAFLLLKTVVLTSLDVRPIAPQYRAIVGAHVVGAMLSAEADLSPADRALLDTILPLDEWAHSYRCENVVPIFWNPKLHRDLMGTNAMAINRIALQFIFAHPGVFLNHQACVTRLIWRIRPPRGEWLPISTLEITDVEQFRGLGLKMQPKWEALKPRLSEVQEAWASGHWWARPATWMFAAALVVAVLVLTVERRLWLIAMPAFLNAGSLLPIIGAQDFRYLWPSMLLAMLVIAFGIVVPKRHVRRLASEAES